MKYIFDSECQILCDNCEITVAIEGQPTSMEQKEQLPTPSAYGDSMPAAQLSPEGLPEQRISVVAIRNSVSRITKIVSVPTYLWEAGEVVNAFDRCKDGPIMVSSGILGLERRLACTALESIKAQGPFQH